MKKYFIFIFILFSLSCNELQNHKEVNYSLPEKKSTKEWYFQSFLPEINEPNLQDLPLTHDAIRVVLLSPMGLPSFVYTVKHIDKKQTIVSYKRNCRWNYSMEGKSWITNSDTLLNKILFSKSFFQKKVSEELLGDDMLWVVEQKSHENINYQSTLGTSIQDKPLEIEQFFGNLPEFVPLLDSLIKENCHIKYK